MPSRILSRFLGNEKARAKLLSGAIAAVMVLAVMGGLFIMSQPASAGDDYNYTENYEDDTAGSPPTESWYTLEVTGPWQNYNVSSDQAHGGSNSQNFSHADGAAQAKAFYNLSSSISPKFVNFSYYPTSSNEHIRISMANGFPNWITYIHLGYGDPVDNQIRWKTDSSTTVDSGIFYVSDTWNNISIEFNWTGHTYQLHCNNGTAADSSWIPFYDSSTYNNFNMIFITSDLDAVQMYIDDWYIGNGTASNTPPTVSITSPSDGATVNGTVSIQGTASDSDGTVQSVQVKIGSDAWANASGTTSWTFSWDTTGYSDGNHTILARSYDGTDYSTNASITVTVDNVADTDPSVALSGLTSGKITWDGTAPGSYWCNATGAGNETLNIAITGGSGANDTDVTQINITVPGDLTNGSNTIDPSAITLYVSVDNSTFHSMGAFPSNGGTIVLNATTWTWTDDPFPISGNDNIYCRFKITYADGQAVGTYTKTGVTVDILG